MRNNSEHQFEKGFTLLELLTIVGLLGILAAVMCLQLTKFLESGKVSAANGELGMVNTAVQASMADAGVSTIVEGSTLSSINALTITGMVTCDVGNYLQGGIARLNGTYTLNSDGFVLSADYPGGPVFVAGDGKFE